MKQTRQFSTISRRHALAMLGAAGAAVLVGVPAYADGAAVAAKIKGLTGGNSVGEGAIELDLPEIAENGNAVKVAFSIDSPMTANNYVKAVHVMQYFCRGNPGVGKGSFIPKVGNTCINDIPCGIHLVKVRSRTISSSITQASCK